MSELDRPALAWVAIVLLGGLVVTNGVFLALLRTGGPLFGIVGYAILLAVVWREQRCDYRAAVVGGVVGLAVHAAEVVLAGWTAYPALMVLNLVLPGVLALVAWSATRRG
jgi:hypothetical protein